LIEDLLFSGHEFVLTARLQSDPIERRFGQYRQTSGGRFLISDSEKDFNSSEKILKNKALIKKGVEIYSTALSNEGGAVEVANSMKKVEKTVGEANSLQLNDDQRRGKYRAHRTVISWWTEESIDAFDYSGIPIICCFGCKFSRNTIVKHTDNFANRIYNVVCNCFFNNHRKRSNESVVKDRVAEFKKVKRQKD